MLGSSTYFMGMTICGFHDNKKALNPWALGLTPPLLMYILTDVMSSLIAIRCLHAVTYDMSALATA